MAAVDASAPVQSVPVQQSPLAFIDLKAQKQRLGPAVDAAVLAVLAHGQYIMGPEIARLEALLAEMAGRRHAIACSSGTDALIMLLMAQGIGPGDAVFCPSFTFAATAECIALLGAEPVFVDVRPHDFNLDPESLEEAVAAARDSHLTPRGIIAVDLFGQPADFPAIEAIARAEDLWVLDDAAQGFGAILNNRPVGAWGDFAATSFFPAKPLGCYGDGGACFVDDDALAETLKSIRIHGQGRDKYENVRLGITGRMDTIQAAVLIEKIGIFPEEIIARQRIAARYNDLLAGHVTVPRLNDGATSVWAQYTIRLPDGARRDEIQKKLQAQGVPSAIYYPRPLHRQTAYARYLLAPGGLPVTEALAEDVLSLPMHPYLSEQDQDRVVAALMAVLA